MTLSDLSIRRPVFAWMLMVGLILFGAIAFRGMGVSQLPDVDFPVVTVTATMQGAAPEVMETDIVDPIEDALMSIEGVKDVTSASRNGNATVRAEFDLSRNIDLAMQDVTAKIAQVQRLLPKEMDPPVVAKTNPDDQPIIWLSLQSDKIPMRDLMLYTRDSLKDQFSMVPGVGDIQLGGYLEPEMRVWVDTKKMNERQLSVTDIIKNIQAGSVEPPAGYLDRGQTEYNVRVLGEASNAKQFASLALTSRGNGPNFAPLPLGDVAKVEEGLEDVRNVSRAKGQMSVGLGIRKQRGSNAVAVARGVRARVEEVKKSLPPGMTLNTVFDSTRFIEQSVGELNFTLVLSALLTAVVCWIFLGSWTSTVNVLLAIPTSIVGAFTLLKAFGFTLNTFTLMGLSLAIGIVVDDAIMVLENIVRHREHGLSRLDAARLGAREITFAAVATSAAIIAIFLPVAFMKGIVGKFFFQFGLTITVAVALSLLEALTLTPMRCAAWVEAANRTTKFGRGVEWLFEKTRVLYLKLLSLALAHRWWTISAALLFFVASLLATRGLNKEFLPPEDQSRFMVRVTAPVGSSMAYTDGVVKKLEAFFNGRPEVDNFFFSLGGFGGGQVNAAMGFITLKEPGRRGKAAELGHEPSQQEFMGIVRKQFSKDVGARVVMQDLAMRGFTTGRGFPVEFSLQGPQWDGLQKAADGIMKSMRESGLMTDVDTDFQIGQPEIDVIPDRDAAVRHGVNVSEIGQVISTGVGGYRVGQYPAGGHRYYIRVKLPDTDEDLEKKINGQFVRNNRGELVPLSRVVKIEHRKTLQIVNRRNRQRAISIYANIAPGKSQQTALDNIAATSKQVLPAGYRLDLSGSSQTFKESFDSLIFAFILGLAVAYMVLASQFNSFFDPITVLVALPFSFSGAFLALLLMHQSINLYSMIGLILLMGIVKKNSILLVDFTNQVRDRGAASVKEALLEACPVRLRPILMTSIAVIAGALPPALAIGPGAESRIPMSVAVIGGVTVSTFLTLFVVPVVYTLFTKKERKEVANDDSLAGTVSVGDFAVTPAPA